MDDKVNAQYSVSRAGSLADRIATRMRRRMYERFLATGVHDEDSMLDVGVTSDAELEASNYLEAWYPHKSMITACGIDDASALELIYPGVRYVRADGRNLPFADASFDVVHSSAVLEHVGSRENQAAFIRELARVARRIVFLTTPNRGFPIEFHSVLPFVHWLPPRIFRALLRGIGHDTLAREENLNLLRAADLRTLCNDIGLQDFRIGSVRLLGWPSNLLLTIRK